MVISGLSNINQPRDSNDSETFMYFNYIIKKLGFEMLTLSYVEDV